MVAMEVDSGVEEELTKVEEQEEEVVVDALPYIDHGELGHSVLVGDSLVQPHSHVSAWMP